MEEGQHGFAVVQGWRFPITKLEILQGRLLLTCSRAGPVPSLDGPVTIFGADGLGFIQGGLGCVTQASGEQAVTITISLVIDRVSS